jgi:hypothetical protein
VRLFISTIPLNIVSRGPNANANRRNHHWILSARRQSIGEHASSKLW